MTTSAPGSTPPSANDAAFSEQTAASQPATRGRSGLGLAAVIVAAVALSPAVLLVLISLIPGMNAVLWLLIVVLPVVGLLGLVALILGIIALVKARPGVSKTLPIVGTALGAFAVLAPVSLVFGWWA
ncbi:hypothetical protein [Microbacterium sp. R86528]|uniref:hypothetical protein n=1 Tax=Microbacterium sp. R86528 TaxID=3093864 RepID=UPI0037C81B1E